MTSINDEQKIVDTNFNIIQQFERSSFGELASIVTSTLAGVLLWSIWSESCITRFRMELSAREYNCRSANRNTTLPKSSITRNTSRNPACPANRSFKRHRDYSGQRSAKVSHCSHKQGGKKPIYFAQNTLRSFNMLHLLFSVEH